MAVVRRGYKGFGALPLRSYDYQILLMINHYIIDDVLG
jgi:hypothetical protein